MEASANKTAILYFTRSAAEEARAKSFHGAGNFAQNRAIAQKLIDHTFAQIKASGLPVRVISTSSQRGRTFGEKFTHAFQSLYEEGFENVIAVGNDCIQLDAKDLTHTAELLQTHALVAGPTVDGGGYLFGISRRAFQARAFCGLAWETDQLMSDFEYYARRAGFNVAYLPLSADIDNEIVLHQLLRHISVNVLYRRLILLIQSIIGSIVGGFKQWSPSYISCQRCSGYTRRGPPIR